jgi:DNA polymerase eta
MLEKVRSPDGDYQLLTIDIGYEVSRSKQSAFPFTHDVTVDVIAAAADKLWKELTGNMKDLNVTSVQLAFTGIETAETGQQSIEGFFKPKEAPRSLLKRTWSSSDEAPPKSHTLQVMAEMPGSVSSTSFACERCNKRITVCESEVDDAEADHAVALAKLRAEHDDFHFAQDLANDTDAQAPSQRRSRSGPPKRKKTTEPKGIAKFFIKK